MSDLEKEENNKTHAEEQFDMGCDCYKTGQVEQARQHWKKIQREDDKQIYAKAQYNLGISYNEAGQGEQGCKHWKEIQREDDKQVYALAQYNLGLFYDKAGQVEQGCKHWKEIQREDDKQIYALAQFTLGLSYDKAGKVEQGCKHWKEIQREDDKQIYANAQYNLGLFYDKAGKIEQGCKHWKEIQREDDKQIYANAQYNLGLFYGKAGKVEQACEHLKKIIKIQCCFEAGNYQRDLVLYSMRKVAAFLLENKLNAELLKGKDLLDSLTDIQGNVTNIWENLHVNSRLNNDSNLIQAEDQFAHYTSAKVAEIIIKKGSFHLGVANHMNDPSEGKVLLNELNIPLNYNPDLLAFLTSFTLNENSLNQFRLYGKIDHIDGSGVSLVVAPPFFNAVLNPQTLSYINMASLSGETTKVMNSIKEPQILEGNLTVNTDKKNQKRILEKLPLFRCIYINPQTDYISVAQKSKLSFYLRNDGKDSKETWLEYNERINTITQKVKEELDKIKKSIKEIVDLIEQDGIYQQNEVYDALATILLPIIYLTKHAAFEEEAECRILYMTSIFDKIIQQDNERVYVEYAIDLADQYDQDKKTYNYLKKIYLGPNISSRAELNLKKSWVDRMREKGKTDQPIPIIEKSTMPLAK